MVNNEEVFKPVGSMFSDAYREIKRQQQGVDPRAFDGKVREWTIEMGDECYCNGKKVVLDANMMQRYCICNQDDWVERCQRACGIAQGILDNYTFLTFVRDLNPGAWGHRTSMMRFAEKDSGSAPWQVLWGHVGTGKTHLIRATVGMMVARGVSVRYFNSYEMMGDLRGAIDTNGVQDFVKRMSLVPVLVIDDLGTEMQTDFIATHFFAILDQRHTARRRTILSFNPEGFARLDPRLKSRIADFSISNSMEFTGEDIRPKVRS